MVTGAIFHLVTDKGDTYHIGIDALHTYEVSKDVAINFIGNLILSGATLSYFKDPETKDELWETE